MNILMRMQLCLVDSFDCERQRGEKIAAVSDYFSVHHVIRNLKS